MPGKVARAARVAVPAVLLAAATQLPHSASAEDQVAAIRAATDRFHSAAQANAADYLDNPLPCFDNYAAADPGDRGGMGEHLINGSLIDANLDPLHPEALVYEVRPDGKLKFVAVEYIAPRAPMDAAPRFLGETMDETTLPDGTMLWTLHAWVAKDNPKGLFSAWNPNVGACP